MRLVKSVARSGATPHDLRFARRIGSPWARLAIAAVVLLVPASAYAAPAAELRAVEPSEIIRSDARRASALADGTAGERRRERRGAVLPFPITFGVFPAGTYDDAGERLGGAALSLIEREDGLIHVTIATGVEGGARTDASALLRRVEGGNGVYVVSEQTESHDETGQSLGVMRIDHDRGIGSCTPSGGDEVDAEVVQLPDNERVVNVPLNLLFLPLVRGELERVDFQYFLCRGGARLMDFRAKLAGGPRDAGGRKFIEVSYGPDLGAIGSWIVARMIPKLSFWFEMSDGGRYLAHRMPLFSKGPEVVVVRDGMTPSALLQAN